MSSVESNPANEAPDLTAEWEYVSDKRLPWWFLMASALWTLLALLALVANLYSLVQPDAFAPEYAFACLQPLHWHLILFGMIANGLFGGIYFSVQRLCKIRIRHRALAYLHFWCWQVVCVWIVSSLLGGHRQHREFGELVWTIDVAVLATWCIFALVLISSIFSRRERHLYPSLWFYLASAIAVPPIYLLGNLSVPGQGYESESLLRGMADGFAQSWSAEGLLLFMVVMPTMGLMYYFLPKATGLPLQNYRMVVIQFWGMTAFALLACSRWLHFTAIPEWISTLGMLGGVLMFFPTWVGVVSGWGHVRRAFQRGQFQRQPSLWFFSASVCVLAFIAIEYSLTSFKSVMTVVGFTGWRSANFYAITLGWSAFIIAGSGLVMAQATLRRSLWNPTWVRAQFWVMATGTAVLLVAYYLGSLIQGFMGGQTDSLGTLAYPEFVEIVGFVSPLWWMAMFAAALCSLAACMMLYYLSVSWALRNRKPATRTTLAPKLPAEYETEQPEASRLEGAPVLGIGIKIDQLNQFVWHRSWERSGPRFVVVLGALLVFGIGLEFLPVWASRDAVTSPAEAQFTTLELVGREIYLREGCVSCHSQTSRPLMGEVARYNDFSVAQDFAFDQPALWRSRRIGPDLSQEGGRRNSFWHWQHLQNPSIVSEGSVMPEFSYLLAQDFALEEVRAILMQEAERGAEIDSKLLEPDELTEEDRLFGEITPLEAELQRQAEVIAADLVSSGGPAGKLSQEAIALIAYLQRLGAQ